MMSLIKQAQTNTIILAEQAFNLNNGLTTLSITYKEEVDQFNESISHVLANVATTVQNQQPIDPKLAHGPLQTLAAYLAGVEFLARNPTPPAGVRSYLSTVAVQNGQITNMNMVGKVGQIGNEKNQPRRDEILASLEQYNANTTDKSAQHALLTTTAKLRQLVDKISQQQQPQQPPRPQTQPVIAPTPQKPVMS